MVDLNGQLAGIYIDTSQMDGIGYDISLYWFIGKQITKVLSVLVIAQMSF